MPLRPKYIPFVFIFYNVIGVLLMKEMKISNVAFPASTQGLGSDLLIRCRTRCGSLWGHKWLPSLRVGMVLLLHLSAYVGFFPSGHLFFPPKVLSD